MRVCSTLRRRWLFLSLGLLVVIGGYFVLHHRFLQPINIQKEEKTTVTPLASEVKLEAQPAVIVRGIRVPLEVGKKYRLIYYTLGTRNSRPRTPTEERRYAQLREKLQEKPLEAEERPRILAELEAIDAETRLPSLVTDVFWLPAPNQRKEPPDSEAIVIDLKEKTAPAMR